MSERCQEEMPRHMISDQADIRHINGCDFLNAPPSGFNMKTNQHDTRQTITKRCQRLSDGLMWHMWERRCVRDRRGTRWNSEARGLISDQDWKTGSTPLTRRPLAHETLSVSGVRSGGWPTFTCLTHALRLFVTHEATVFTPSYAVLCRPQAFLSIYFTFDLCDLCWLRIKSGASLEPERSTKTLHLLKLAKWMRLNIRVWKSFNFDKDWMYIVSEEVRGSDLMGMIVRC